MYSSRSALDAMRTLAQHLDSSLEGVLEAHGFALDELKAGIGGASARFVAEAESGWTLAIHAEGVGMDVELTHPTQESPRILLRLKAGSEGLSLPQAVVTAVSLIGLVEQTAPPA